MAAPALTDASVSVPNLLLLSFSEPLAPVATPLEYFTVNHGVISVTSLSYSTNSTIALGLDTSLGHGDKVFISYTPPIDVNECLRGVLPGGASDIDKKIHSVKQFSRFTVRNLIQPAPNLDTNLGTKDGQGYPISDRSSDPRLATTDDFILAYGERETIQLTNLEDGSATAVNVPKLEMALEDANALIDNYITQAGKAGKYLISSNRRRTALMIARYYLDTVRRREDVYKDYQDCIKEMESAKSGSSREGTPAIETKRGAIRVHRIPQMYNRVTGKGLSGWATDSDMEREDYRGDLFESQNLREGAPSSSEGDNPRLDVTFENDVFE